MNLPFFENTLGTVEAQSPNEFFRDLQQAAIDDLFDCTSAKYTIKEQDYIGSPNFHDIDVWLDYIVGTTSSGVKNGIDFTKVMFRDINHEVKQGLYYIFDDNYHIAYFTNRYDGVEKSTAVRRCNNFMRIVDPETGQIITVPCVIDYDMSSPSVQVSSSILTPNNHAFVMVQGNPETLRLFKLNTRYIFGGRPFKLTGYQNALMYSIQDEKPTLLYLDLYLDEIHAQDDLENQIAYNGTFDYQVTINAESMELTNGATGTLTAATTLNGASIDRPIVWSSSNPKAVVIDDYGVYHVVGEVGETAEITATLAVPNGAKDSITISIKETESLLPDIFLTPSFSKLRQYESIDFTVGVMYGDDALTSIDNISVSLSPDIQTLSNDYITITGENNQYTIFAKDVAESKQIVYVSVSNNEPAINKTKEFAIDVVSMFG